MLSIAFACQPQDNQSTNSAEEARFVWVNEAAQGRMQMAFFRNDFELESVPDEALFNLFASSRYHLFVNGTMINFGPLRFYPENPEYDTYDLSPYLKPGKNVIAVKVLYNGTNTYQLLKMVAGFRAWGSFGGHQFSTPGSWVCQKSQGYDETAPKLSFAMGAMEVYDARKDPKGWNSLGFDSQNWKKPVETSQQDAFGSFSPRTIPHLTQDPVIAKSIAGVYSIKEDEQIYSFRRKSADSTVEAFRQNKWAFAYSYIYSPKAQEVDAGLWWGEFWLNGEGPLPGKGVEPGRPNRSDVTLNLKKGWNFFFIKYGIVWGSWDFYLALPRSADLVLSPDKDPGNPNAFMAAGPFTADEEQRVRALDLPFFSPKDLPNNLSEQWEPQPRIKTAGNPAWEIAWSYFDENLNHPPHQVQDISIKAAQPTAVVADLGGKQLGRIFVEFEAPEGTILDVGFAEDLAGNKPYILKRAGVYTATRHIAAGGKGRLETFRPYGARYLQINIHNHSDSVTVNNFGIVSQRYPFTLAGQFECSDPMYNDIWKLGWRTLLVCSEDSYTDTPFRERGLYAGDALPEFAITLATSGDPLLIKRSLELFHDMYNTSFTPEPASDNSKISDLSEFIQITTEYFRWYVDVTGDLDFARKLYPGYKYMIEQNLSERDDDGLITKDRVFIEWTQIEKSHVKNTAFHAHLARSCMSMASLADRLGKPDEKQFFLDAEKEIVDAMFENLWNKERQLFHDGKKNGELLESFYPISSALPLLYGYTTPEQNRSIGQYLESQLKDIGDISRKRRTTPYGGFYIIGALYKNGQAKVAEDFIRKYWSPMILKLDDTAWENFDDGTESGAQGTLSHAWSGGPTFHLSQSVLGVPLGYPSIDYKFDEITLRPQSSHIKWAKGNVPHPKGAIHVDWQVKGNQLLYNFTAPSGLKVKVEPQGRLSELDLVVNGKK